MESMRRNPANSDRTDDDALETKADFLQPMRTVAELELIAMAAIIQILTAQAS
jgi:hypothetical protein